MRALVTGGAGFIGSHIVDRLVARGLEVRILDSLEPRVHPKGRPGYLPRDVEFIQGDVTDPRDVSRALRGVETVFHLAAYRDYMPDYGRFLRVNAAGTALLYETIVDERLSIAKVVLASSQAVYGEGQYRCASDGLFVAAPRGASQLERSDWEVRCPRCRAPSEPAPLDEENPSPGNAYAISKHAAELIALRLGRHHGIPSVVLRYSNTQGPRQSLHNGYSGVLRLFTDRLLRGHPPVLYEDGRQQRDYVHIDDVVDATMLALDDPRAEYGTFNVGGRRVTTVRQYAKILSDRLHFDGELVERGEYRVGDCRHNVSSVARLMALGWKPMRTLERIVSDYLDWARSRSSAHPMAERAHQVMRARGVIVAAGAR